MITRSPTLMGPRNLTSSTARSCGWDLQRRVAAMVQAATIQAITWPPKAVWWWFACGGRTSSTLSSVVLRGEIFSSVDFTFSGREVHCWRSVSPFCFSASSLRLVGYCIRNRLLSLARAYCNFSSAVNGTTGVKRCFWLFLSNATKVKKALQTSCTLPLRRSSTLTETPTSMLVLNARFTRAVKLTTWPT